MLELFWEALESAGIQVPSKIPESIEIALSLVATNSVVVMGGTVPGHTTDNVAITMACNLEAERCIIGYKRKSRSQCRSIYQ